MQRVKEYILIALLPLALSACDFSEATEVIGCSIEDEKLGIAFRNPAKAKRYLEKLNLRLAENDPDAIREASDLVARVAECL